MVQSNSATLSALKKTIKQLNDRWEELDGISLVTKSPNRTLEILDDMELVSNRIARLKIMRAHLNASAIAVDPPNAKDKKQIEDALNILSTHIAKDMKWAARVRLTKGILAAARTINENINGRQAKQNP